MPPQRAHRFAPTVLPLAQSVPARPSAPLDNRKIAFGCVRLAPPPLCAKAARLSGAMRRAVGTGALAALGRLATPPPQIPLSPRCAIHPRMRLAWLGRDTSLRPATPPRGVLRIPAQNPLWPRGQCRPIPPALFAECRRKRCRLHLSICATPALRSILARVCLPCAKRGVEAAARGGASADGGTRKTPRMRLRGATGGIPTKRLAAQARLDCAPYGGCARGSRRCAAAAPLEAQR